MAYLKVIEESTTWTCPKTADYKVICVAGGCPGGFIFKGVEYTVGVAVGTGCIVSEPCFGEATSFGSYLTASGSINGTPYADIEYGEVHNLTNTSTDELMEITTYYGGPIKGFLLHNSPYGEKIKKLPSDDSIVAASFSGSLWYDHIDSEFKSFIHSIKKPEGYGAGGNHLTFLLNKSTVSASASKGDGKYYVGVNAIKGWDTVKDALAYDANQQSITIDTAKTIGGSCGNLTMGIVTISKDTKVTCTVGRSVYPDEVTEPLYNYQNMVNRDIEWTSLNDTLGNDGVIIIQEV